MADETTHTVKFNVGGRHFEVSRSLIEEHQETVLGKPVSATWNDEPERAVFIDRDGDIFAQILNYLRYGSIELPISMPYSMFVRELDYYGITSVEGSIKKESLPKIIDSFTKPLAQAKQNHDMILLTYECYVQFNQFRINNPESKSADVDIAQHHKVYANVSIAGEKRNLFDTYLEGYFGLMVPAESTVYQGSYRFSVQMKE